MISNLKESYVLSPKHVNMLSMAIVHDTWILNQLASCESGNNEVCPIILSPFMEHTIYWKYMTDTATSLYCMQMSSTQITKINFHRQLIFLALCRRRELPSFDSPA